MKETLSQGPQSQGQSSLRHCYAPSWTDIHSVRTQRAEANPGKSALRPGHQDHSHKARASDMGKMGRHQRHPELGTSFAVIFKQDNYPETRHLPVHKSLHPFICLSIHLSIHLSNQPFIHPFDWPSCGERERNGCPCCGLGALASNTFAFAP